MAEKEPGWVIEAPGKGKMEKEDENGNSNRDAVA